MSKTSNINTDFGYVNVLLNNDTDDFLVAEYNATQRQPILTNMQDFQMGVVRLKIPTSAIPLMVFEDDAYTIGFSLGNTDTNLLTQVVTHDLPANTSQQYPYNRFIFYYNQLLTDVNNALANLWAQALIDPAYAAVLATYTQNETPRFRLVKDQAYIELLVPINPTGTSFYPANPLGINISMSKKLFYFFSGFSAQINTIGGWGGDPRLSYKLQIGNYLNGDTIESVFAYPPIDPAMEFNVISQDYPSLFLWQTLTRIIITTSIPIEQEVIVTRDNQGKTNRQAVLTDFEISQTQVGLREYIYFFPQGDLRWSNFKGTGWLDRFDMKVWFQTKDLTIYPIQIPPTFEFSIKIEFKRRKAKELLQYTKDTSEIQYF